ncbi:MAG: hypothetical protein MRJ68_02450 [Nitrospira sp.]|nr:hypothetical protein [Nitrospira sp.]
MSAVFLRHSCIALSPVMDIVYNPLETQLLKDAKAVGCKTIPGLEMFLHQAAARFELWTKIRRLRLLWVRSLISSERGADRA